VESLARLASAIDTVAIVGVVATNTVVTADGSESKIPTKTRKLSQLTKELPAGQAARKRCDSLGTHRNPPN